jgi:hypothetical protein
MTNNSRLSALKAEPGQARFVHFLSPSSFSLYKETNRRRSRNDRSQAGRRVPRFFDSLGLSNLRRRHFLSMYVITEFTESGSFAAAGGYSAGSNYAIEVPISSFDGRDVYVFNGDVQDLAAPKARKPAYIRFEGDISALMSTMLEWRNQLPDRRDGQVFICEARLMEALSPKLNPIFHGCPDSMSAEDDGALSLALDEYILEGED